MAGLCGWFSGSATGGQASALIARMSAAIPREPGSVARSHSAGGLAVAVVGLPVETDLHIDGPVVAAIVGRPRWRGEYAELATRDGDAAALAAAFTRLGRGLFDVVGGPITLFAADNAAKRAVAAVDRVGIHSLCYAAGDGTPFVFGATADSVKLYPGTDGTISPQALFDYLYFTIAPAPSTIYRGQRKLLAAQYLWHEGGRTSAEYYWQMPFGETDRRPMAELGAELREIVRHAVGRAIQDSDPAALGAFLSGGVDSSTVVGMLAQSGLGQARAFTIGFREDRYDEMPYARIAARHFGARHYEYTVTPDDVAEVIPKIAAIYDEPFANSSAVPVYCCARLARENGVTMMLAGDGGDELFGGNFRYVQQRYFDLYFYAPQWFRRAVMEPVIRGFPFGGSIPLLRTARGYIAKTKVPLPERLQVFNFFSQCGPDQVIAPDILAEVDARHPAAVMRASYDRVRAPSNLQRMLGLDLQVTLADGDLRKVTRMCQAAGVAVRFPLLDEEIVRFAARVPPELCIKGFKLRYFFKEAFRDFLPNETLTKSKQGFGLPFAVWLRTDRRLADLVNDSIVALKRRRLFRNQFLDEVVAGRAEGLQSYHDDVSWALMMLELWLREHADAPVAAHV